MSLLTCMLSQVASDPSNGLQISSELLIHSAGWLAAGCVIGLCASLVVRSLRVKAGLIGGLLAGVLAAVGFILASAKSGEVLGHLAAACLVLLATALMIARARMRALTMDGEHLVGLGDGDPLGARMRSGEAKSGTKPAPPEPLPDLDLDLDIEPEPSEAVMTAGLDDDAIAPEPETKAEDDPVEQDTEDPPEKVEKPEATQMSTPGGMSTDPAPPAPPATTKAAPKPKAKPPAKPAAKPKGSGKPSWMQ